MKKTTKRDLRRQLDEEVSRFLDSGGQVKQVARGESGLDNGRYDERGRGFEKPKSERTPVDDVLKAIDQRRQAQRTPVKKTTSRPRTPRKKVIYDDFGEPLRVIWTDE